MANEPDLSAAWHAHAPSPPPSATSSSRSASPFKAKRRASYDPAASASGSSSLPKGQGFDPHTQGGVLPPDSFSPEPETSSSRRNSVIRADLVSISTPSSPVKRHRTRTATSPAPPASSALYNYKHQQLQQQQQQQQQQQFYQQQQNHPYQQPSQQYAASPASHYAPPSSVGPAIDGSYTRARHDSSPYPMAAAHASHSGYAIGSPGHQPAQLPSAILGTHPQPPFQAVPPPSKVAVDPAYAHAHYAHQAPQHFQTSAVQTQTFAAPLVATNGWDTYASMQPYGAPSAPQQPQAPNGYAPHAQPSSNYYTTPPQQHVAAFSGTVPAGQSPPPLVPNEMYHHAMSSGYASAAQPSVSVPAPAPATAPATAVHVFPSQGPVPPQPFSPPFNGHTSSLSRQSTVSSVSSVRRPLPQPNPARTNSLMSAPVSPLAGAPSSPTLGSVRRDLPRLPPATISHATGSSSHSTTERPSGSPQAPLSTLNRTESVRLAAEALMARGVPQRRPLRSALRNTTFSSPYAAPSDPAQQRGTLATISSSQSEPVAQAPNGHAPAATATHGAPSPSQSAGPGIPSSGQQWSPAPMQIAELQSHPQQSQQTQQPVHPGVQDGGGEQPQPTSRPPASYQRAVEQTQRQALPSQPAPEVRASPQPASLADSFGQMSMDARDAAVEVRKPAQFQRDGQADRSSATAPPSIAITDGNDDAEGSEKPRRRGGSVSRSRQRAPSPAPAAKPTIPIINFPGDDAGNDDDGGRGNGPVISISGPDDNLDDSSPGDGAPFISITTEDDDDVRSQTSSGSKGPSVSISFSGDPAGAKPQQAKTTEGPYSRSGRDHGAASASSVGGGAQCYACRKYIAGKVVHALNTTFHPACFVCAHCSEGLEHVAFYEHDGLPYCHFDYHEQFSRRCFHCRTPIVDERFITVQDEELTGRGGKDGDGEVKERCYHELHFFCANCGDPFLDPKAAGSAAGADPSLVAADEDGRVKAGGMEFIVHKGYPYCEKCHINLHKPRCKKCRQPIVGDLVTALNAKYHPDCFVCHRCDRPFEETSFFVRDGKAYDEDCYKVILRNLV